ncbi:hypothetical protein L6164_009269 [Bauhinia variegata]|uniref:Uncharacterized protein n=1 Tax=Bauhinia variegata TaxID=167791 RepID=A0ACB9PKN1_BAUVA|nr:hypothetical protein L6164_009269 [Bauhinia variegata]
MLTSPAALTRKSILSSHTVKFSGRPPSHSGYQSLLSPTTPIQASTIRYSLRHSYPYPLNSSHGVFSKKLGGSGMGFGRLGFDNLQFSAVADDGSGRNGGSGSRNVGGRGDGSGNEGTGGGGEKWSFLSRILKKLESMNTLGSSVWWVFGFYCIVMGGPALLQVCPLLYGLTEVFLDFDVFFNIFGIVMACIIFFVFFCFIVIVATVALAYAVKMREGASDADIRSLPKYRFSQSNLLVMVDDNQKQVVKARTDTDNSNHASELSLHPDDSMEQNSIAFPAPTFFIVDASADGFGLKQPAPSANSISSEVCQCHTGTATELLQCTYSPSEHHLLVLR